MPDTTIPDEPVRLLALVPAALVALMAVAAGSASAYAPPDTGDMAVVFPPWVDAAGAYAAVLAAGGRFAGGSRFDNIPIANARDVGFKARVLSEGALFIVAATGVCGPVSSPPAPGELS
ncbi:hypothetical protein [Devosia sp.]|uniref:hypothetical protein n=1 Tax=Devosia sp. TaxID=1871048 RepID=UPI0035B03E7E